MAERAGGCLVRSAGGFELAMSALNEGIPPESPLGGFSVTRDQHADGLCIDKRETTELTCSRRLLDGAFGISALFLGHGWPRLITVSS